MKKSLFTLASVAGILLGLTCGWTARADDTKVDAGTVVVLNNGARLIVLPDKQSDIVSVNVFFTVGRAEERATPGINGLLCRTWGNASQFRTAALLQGDIARTGGIGTEYSEDWVEIWGVSGNGPGDIRKSFQTVLVNLVSNPLFTPEGVATAREGQERTALLERDDLVTTAMDMLRSRAFGGSAYSISAIGAPERLLSVKPETLSAYYARYFRPNRCIVVVSGKVDADETRRLVEASFGAGDWNSGPPAPATPAQAIAPIPVGLRDAVLSRSAPATVFSLGWLAPGTAPGTDENENRKRYATLVLLDAVIGGGKACRLFHDLRDTDPIGYDVRTSLAPGRAGSLWAVYVTGGRDREATRTALTDEIGALTNGKHPITQNELVRARAYCKTRFLKDNERIRDRAFTAGWAEVMGLGAAYATDFDKLLDAVTLDDVNQMAHTVFSGNPVAVFSQPSAPPAKAE